MVGVASLRTKLLRTSQNLPDYCVTMEIGDGNESFRCRLVLHEMNVLFFLHIICQTTNKENINSISALTTISNAILIGGPFLCKQHICDAYLTVDFCQLSIRRYGGCFCKDGNGVWRSNNQSFLQCKFSFLLACDCNL